MSSAIQSVEDHIYGLLNGDAALAVIVTGGWHLEKAPRGATFPHGIISANDPGTDRNIMGTGPNRAFTRFTYLVKIVTSGGSFQDNYAGMTQAEELLGGSHAVKVLGVYRVGSVKYTEQDGDVQYNHFGHLYRAFGKD